MDFGEALRALRDGKRVSRESWTYVGECVILQGQYEGALSVVAPHLLRRQPDGVYQPWTPRHDDLLAEDWELHVWPLPR